jgi:presenilin-like A22 family membrane protease
MIKLAKFQSKTKVFAGLLIPYDKKRIISYEPTSKSEVGEKKAKVAVLGGGDIGFTLIFAGVVMKGLMLKEAMLHGFLKTLIIPVFVSLALLILLLKGQQNKFYPAMPVLSLGCFIGYLVVLAI